MGNTQGVSKKFDIIWHVNITETTSSNQMDVNRFNVDQKKIFSCKFE